MGRGSGQIREEQATAADILYGRSRQQNWNQFVERIKEAIAEEGFEEAWQLIIQVEKLQAPEEIRQQALNIGVRELLLDVYGQHYREQGMIIIGEPDEDHNKEKFQEHDYLLEQAKQHLEQALVENSSPNQPQFDYIKSLWSRRTGVGPQAERRVKANLTEEECQLLNENPELLWLPMGKQYLNKLNLSESLLTQSLRRRLEEVDLSNSHSERVIASAPGYVYRQAGVPLHILADGQHTGELGHGHGRERLKTVCGRTLKYGHPVKRGEWHKATNTSEPGYQPAYLRSSYRQCKHCQKNESAPDPAIEQSYDDYGVLTEQETRELHQLIAANLLPLSSNRDMAPQIQQLLQATRSLSAEVLEQRIKTADPDKFPQALRSLTRRFLTQALRGRRVSAYSIKIDPEQATDAHLHSLSQMLFNVGDDSKDSEKLYERLKDDGVLIN